MQKRKVGRGGGVKGGVRPNIHTRSTRMYMNEYPSIMLVEYFLSSVYFFFSCVGMNQHLL